LAANRKIRERAQEIVLMRFYETRWRVWDPEADTRRYRKARRSTGDGRQHHPRSRAFPAPIIR
jgi:hypothetical protein